MKTQNTNTTIHGNSKKVIDLTTNTTYNSLKEAAEAMGVHLSAISLVVRGKTKTCKGHRFSFVEESKPITTEDFTPIHVKVKATREFPRAKKVKDITTGKVYDSITEAAKDLGVHRSSVGYAANGNIKACKKHVFRFVDDLPTESHHVAKKYAIKKGKTVLCITTGEVYKSCQEAAIANNLSYASVHSVCYGRQSSHNGLAFCYLEDAPYRVMDIVTGVRKQNITKELNALKTKQTNLLQYKKAYEKATADIAVKQAEVLKELEEVTKKISDFEAKLN